MKSEKFFGFANYEFEVKSKKIQNDGQKGEKLLDSNDLLFGGFRGCCITNQPQIFKIQNGRSNMVK